MVSVSRESREQTEQRLRAVIAGAELVALDGEWTFQEGPVEELPELTDQVLAVVRDEDSWSWLTRATSVGGDRFALFSFHFPEGLDNSGFVGWLATALKEELGTGVLRRMRAEQQAWWHL